MVERQGQNDAVRRAGPFYRARGLSREGTPRPKKRGGATMKCECEYDHKTSSIDFCPLHASAGAMLEALIGIKDELVQFHGNVHGDCTDKGRLTCPTWEAIYRARETISQAERKE